MKHHQHPWNLRRIFGRQTVVCVGSPKWSESGIAAQVILAPSSRWTFHGRDGADLQTCRLADVVVDDRRDPGPLTLVPPQFRRFLNLQKNYRGLWLKP